MSEAADRWSYGEPNGQLDCSVSARGVGLNDKPAHSERLIRTIEAEIVPRLIMTRKLTKGFASREAVEKTRVFDVQELVRLLLGHDAEVSAAYVETVLARGESLENVCVNLLAPAARELGLLWEEDECDFMDVTVGLCRLHQVLRMHAPVPACDEEAGEDSRRILLATVPGEQHTFGITLVGQFLVRAGWDVWQEFPSNERDILELVRQNRFTVAGLTVGNDTCLEQAAALVAAMRRWSRNPDLAILIGGPVLLADPQLAIRVGADATAMDCQQAVNWVETTWRKHHGI